MHPTAEKKHLGTHTHRHANTKSERSCLRSESYKLSLKVPIYKTLEVIHSHVATGDHRKSRIFSDFKNANN